ncbi:unnamed protein product [Blepharisma stoltei]|uniref:MalT-like TPR region domain-containing protein n=1 Tax=Blepharisma stoltei TaxID=1481888 RepID=A0AAU9K5A3_9CILI|nr:unnamed protein product [Blepharisma stoltei]
MLFLLNKISKGAPWRLLLRSIKSQCGLNNFQFRQYSFNSNSIDELRSKIAQAEKDQNLRDLIIFYNKLGFSFWASGKLHESITYHEKSAKIAEKIAGSEYPMLVEQFIHLGHCYREMKVPPKAIEWYEKALKIEINLYGEQSSQVAYTLIDLLIVYHMNNDIEKAEKAIATASHYMNQKVNSADGGAAVYFLYAGHIALSKSKHSLAIDNYKKSRKIYENLSGPITMEIAVIDNLLSIAYMEIKNPAEAKRWAQSTIGIRDTLKVYDMEPVKRLALLCKELGSDKEAEEACEKGAKIAEDLRGLNSVDIALFYNEMGNKFKINGGVEISKKLFAKCLEALKNVPYQNSYEATICYDNLAAEAYRFGELEKSIDCSQKSLAIKSILGMIPYGAKTNYFYLGTAYYDLKNYEKGEEYLLKAKNLLESENDDKYALEACWSGLGFLYRDIGRYAEAVEFSSRGIELACEIQGRIHPEIATRYINLGATYKLWGKWKDSIDAYKKAIEINNQALGPFNFANTDVFSHMAEVYRAQGEFDKAIAEHKRAISARELEFGNNDPGIGVFYYAFADVYKDLKEWDKASELYEKGLQSYLRTVGEKDTMVAVGYVSFGDFYNSKGDKEAAINCYKKAEQVLIEIPGMEARVTRLRSKIESIRRDSNE